MKAKIFQTIKIILVILWLVAMQSSDSIFTPYLLTGIFSIFCCIKAPQQNHNKSITYTFSVILALFVIVANYHLFPHFTASTFPVDITMVISLILGSFVTFYNIFKFLPAIINKYKIPQPKNTNLTPKKIFLLSFIIISAVYLLVFFLCKYPGNLSFDSITQVRQGLTGEYSNHQPFIHTIIIQLFSNIGQNLFGNINAGVATYVVFQIILMSSIFAFSISTIFREFRSKKLAIILLLIYILLPYHIMYSMTVWKDCLLGAFMLLLLATEYRIFKSLGSKWLNYILLVISGFCCCTFKGNGLYIFLAFFALSTILLYKDIFKTRKFLFNFVLLVIIVISAFVYNKAILPSLNVPKSETMESLSIPVQQIARTIKDSNNLNSEQKDLLGHIMNLEEVPTVYNPHLSDPMKEQVWKSSGGENYLLEHKGEYLKLYLELGVAHPLQYLQAWSDQTKGYFNGGYRYWVISNDITDNDINIYKTNENSLPNKAFNAYLSLFENNDVFRIIYCIGFFVWVTLGLLFIAIVKKDKISILLTSVPLFLISTLIIAAPVYSEFRYTYPLFCCLPLLFVINLLSIKKH